MPRDNSHSLSTNDKVMQSAHIQKASHFGSNIAGLGWIKEIFLPVKFLFELFPNFPTFAPLLLSHVFALHWPPS